MKSEQAEMGQWIFEENGRMPTVGIQEEPRLRTIKGDLMRRQLFLKDSIHGGEVGMNNSGRYGRERKQQDS